MLQMSVYDAYYQKLNTENFSVSVSVIHLPHIFV